LKGRFSVSLELVPLQYLTLDCSAPGWPASVTLYTNPSTVGSSMHMQVHGIAIWDMMHHTNRHAIILLHFQHASDAKNKENTQTKVNRPV